MAKAQDVPTKRRCEAMSGMACSAIPDSMLREKYGASAAVLPAAEAKISRHNFM